jgi:outer membrane protein assembly factor BamB
MKRVFSLGILVFVTNCLFAAAPALQWVRSHSDLQPYNLQSVRQLIDPEGNLYVTTRTSTDRSDMSLAKFDPAGNLLWLRHFDNGANLYDEPVGIGLDAEGNIYMAGYGGYERDFAVVKYSSSGDLLWNRGYAGADGMDDIATSMAVDQWGNVYVVGTGQFRHYLYGRLEGALFVSWNSNGDLLFANQAQEYSFAETVAVDSQGRVATGALYPWQSTVFINGYNYGGWRPITLHVDSNDNLFAAFAGGNMVLIKYDSFGVELWRRDPPLEMDSQFTLRSDRKGAVIVMESHDQDDGAFTRVSKYGADGVFAWTTTIPDAFTSLEAVAVTRRGDILVAPIYRQAGWSSRLISFDARGRTKWDIPTASNQVVAALSADDDGNFYTSGHGLVARYSAHK